MAYVVGKLVEYQASGSTFTPNFANIVWDSTLAAADKAILADDFILTGLANRQSSGTDFSTPSGYTKIGTYGVQSSTAHIWWHKKAAGGESGPSYSCTSAECIGITLIVRGVDTTTQITAASARKDWVNVGSFASDTPTAAAGDLVIHSCAYNNTAQFSRAKLSQLTGLARYDAANVGLAVGYKQVESAGAISAVTWYNKNATNGGQAWVICIKTASGAPRQPDIRTNINELNWYGAHGAQHTPVPTTNAWQKPSTFATGALGTLNGINLSSIALGTITTTQQPYGTALGTFSSIPHATDETVWAGAFHAQASTDLRGSLVSVQWAHDLLSTSSRVGAGGAIMVLSDGTNWVAYQLASKAKGWGLLTPNENVIAVGNCTAYASSGTISTTLSAVTQIGFFWHRVSGSATSTSLHIRNLLVIPTELSTSPEHSAHLTGGGSTRPANLSDFYTAALSWEYQALATRQAAGQVMSRIGVFFGDGTNKTYADVSAYPFSFPQAWSASDSGNWQQSWNVNTGAVTLGIKTAATDTINLTATGFVAPNGQLMVIDSASNTGADVSIAGSSIVGMTFTDNAGFALATSTYKQCGTVTLNASASDLSITETTGTVAASMASSGKTLTRCTIDGTGADYALELGTSVTAITLADCTLTAGSTDKVHVLKTLTNVAAGAFVVGVHYRINTVGTTDFTLIGASSNAIGVNFTATGVGSGTGTADQAVKITTSGTTSLAESDCTTAGAPVWVATPAIYQEVQITNLVTGSRVQIYDLTNDTELANEIASGTTVTWTDGTAYVADRDIRVRISYVSGTTAKEFIEAEIGTVGDGTPNASTLTYRANQVADSVYNDNAVNGSAVTGVTFTDSSVDVMNIDVAANSISWPSLYAAWVYYAFSETGIATDIDYIEAVDTANYLLSNLVVKNTSSPSEPLEITGGYGRDSTTLAAIDLVDTSGGTIVMAPDHVVSYAVGSGVTSQDKVDIAAEVLSQASSAPIHANVQKVNDITIDGSGIPPTYDSEGNLTDPGDPFVAA